MMLEAPELRWAFIRKIYSIITFFVSTSPVVAVAVASVVVIVRPISTFFVSTTAGFGLYIFLIILPFTRPFGFAWSLHCGDYLCCWIVVLWLCLVRSGPFIAIDGSIQ